MEKINPKLAKYIKLGAKGDREKDMLDQGLIYIGFGTDNVDIFNASINGEWGKFREIKRQLSEDSKAVITGACNAVRSVYESTEDLLWITFHKDRLYWGFIDVETPPMMRPDLSGSVRKMKGGWSSVDIEEKPLLKQTLSGELDKVSMYRGTVCQVKAFEYLIRRINSEFSPELEAVEKARDNLALLTSNLIRKLHWNDFELLVELLFSRTNWRREKRLGGTEKTTDIVLTEPITKRKAFVQVKGEASQAILDQYMDQLSSFGKLISAYNEMYFVYHTGTLQVATDVENITVIGPDELGWLVVDAGLLDWLISRVH